MPDMKIPPRAESTGEDSEHLTGSSECTNKQPRCRASLTPLQEAVLLARKTEHLARVLKRLFKESLVVTALPLLFMLFSLVRAVRTSAVMVLSVLITGYLCSVIWRSWVVREELRAVRKRLAELA